MLINKSFFWVLLCFLIPRFGESQNNATYPQDYFINPLDIELRLAGSFGELRSNHFHSGLDFKTNQVTGLPVYAAASGYVSRIKIQHYGYGKALYITHPNGYTTVYAHLSKFSPRIEAYVKQQQYVKESYEIELFPTDLDLRVDQVEVVAYSGNTGGSSGPHLHFEIRDAKEFIINPLLFGYKIADSKSPVIKQMIVYPLDENSTVNGKREPYQSRLITQQNGKLKAEQIKAYGNIGIGINTIDYMDFENNQNGVYSIFTHINGSKNFEMVYDRFSFDETRYINQLIDYSFFKEHKSRVSRLYVPEGSPLGLYRNAINNGKLTMIEPGLTHIYNIEVSDKAANTSVITVDIINDVKPEPAPIKDNANLIFVNHNMSFSQSFGRYSLTIPGGALYENALLAITEENDKLIIHKDVIPVHKNMTITYDMTAKKDDNLNQYYIGEVQPWGTVYHLNSKLKGNVLSATTRNFGTYTVAKDDTSPTVEPLNFKNEMWISKLGTLRVKIDDKQSGISGYRATLNGDFILMEYESKDKLLVHDLADNIVKEGENLLKIIVTDNVGNSTTFTAVVHYKS